MLGDRLQAGDLVMFRPWGILYPGFGIVMDTRNDEGLVVVLDPKGGIWSMYPEQVYRVKDD